MVKWPELKGYSWPPPRGSKGHVESRWITWLFFLPESHHCICPWFGKMMLFYISWVISWYLCCNVFVSIYVFKYIYIYRDICIHSILTSSKMSFIYLPLTFCLNITTTKCYAQPIPKLFLTNADTDSLLNQWSHGKKKLGYFPLKSWLFHLGILFIVTWNNPQKLTG